jgi:hypothetical protein
MTSKDILSFYTRLIRDIAEGTQRKVCEANGIPLTPSSASQMQPIPVYEATQASSLLTCANIRHPTEIKWPVTQQYEYLPAYFKRYRKADGRRCNEIVVTANNYCSARFFAAKELMHCFIDEDGYPATNSVELVHDLIDDLVIGIKGLTSYSTPQTIVDEVAWLGASLYLIPQSWIPLLTKSLAAITEAKPSANGYLHLAQLIRVPEIVLRSRIKHAASM